MLGGCRPGLLGDERTLNSRQIPAAGCEIRSANRYHRTKFPNDAGSTGNSVSYKSAISFGVCNPTFLKGLEGL